MSRRAVHEDEPDLGTGEPAHRTATFTLLEPVPVTEQPPVLRVEHVTRCHSVRRRGEPVVALDDVSLTVEAGRGVAVVGLSGAGKSTLLRIMGLLDRPDDGTVTLAGTDVTAMAERHRARLRGAEIGFVFPRLVTLPRRSALRQVSDPLLYGPGPALWRRRATAVEALQRVGLGDRTHVAPHRMSAGEQRLLAIARATVHDPMMILADEPAAGLDPPTARRVCDVLFANAAADGRALVLATHDRSLIGGADEVYELRAGRLTPTG